jgi:3',5'-nucleoside bisphosphate phosphatase
MYGVPVAKEAEKLQRLIAADLHIHTCLSPCATLDMTPRKIVAEACTKGLEIIAVTDHNSAENTPGVIRAATETDLYVIPGIEVTTSEEVHILGLFEEIDQAFAMQRVVYDNLQSGENDEDLFGIQVVSNEFDEVESINTRLLIGATSLNLSEVVDAIHRQKGLAVAAHIDRESFGVIGQLGFIPDDLDLDAVEISKRLPIDQARNRFKEYKRFPFITASDAHDLKEIGTGSIHMHAARAHIDELRQALNGTGGRGIEY